MNNKLLFPTLTFLIPFVLLLFVEWTLRLVNYGDDFDLFSEVSKKGYEAYVHVNPLVGKKYFQHFKYTTAVNDVFLKEKNEDTFRVFVMGSSTMYGFPYPFNLMSSRILQKKMEEAFPNKNIEVINTALTAINSFTLLDFSKQIINNQPDAVIIYAGHNEFYGSFGIGSNETMSRYRFLTNMHIACMDLKLYQLLSNVLLSIRKVEPSKTKKIYGTLMARIVSDKEILLNGASYNLAMKHYEQNLYQIIQGFDKAKIPIYLSEVVSNIKDLVPLDGGGDHELPNSMSVYANAKQVLITSDSLSALALFNEARDIDRVRFRASSDVNRIINNIAKNTNVNLVSMEGIFQSHSPYGIIGDELMIDHVHPNIEGQFLMGDAFYKALIISKAFGIPQENKKVDVDFKSTYGYTSLDSLVAKHRINILKSYWPFVQVNYNSDYREDGHSFSNIIDSLAFLVASNKDFTLLDARFQLIESYEKRGCNLDAYSEYKALLYTDPYSAINYTDAANCLIKLVQYKEALTCFEESLKYKVSFKTIYRMGELCLIIGRFDEAEQYFSRTLTILPSKHQLLKYCKSYLNLLSTGKTEYAQEVAEKLVKVKL